MTVADNNDTCDWVADCDGEGQERAVRDGGDSRVVMMAAAAADYNSECRQRQRRTATACKIGWQPMTGRDKSEQQEMVETRSGNDGWGGGRWHRWTTKTATADDKNGNGGRRHQQMTTAADDDSMQDWAADYKGEGGEWVANNNGIRARRAESVKK